MHEDTLFSLMWVLIMSMTLFFAVYVYRWFRK